MDHPFIVALGDRTYRVERPFGPLPGDAGKVTDVACGPDGTVYVLTRRDAYVDPIADCVHVLGTDGAYLGRWGGDRITDAHKIACDAAGRVIVVDRDSHEIVVFDRDGQELLQIGERHRPLQPFNHPSDVAVATDGSFWVSDGYAGGRVHGFSADAMPIGSFGGVGRAEGAFLTPHGIAVTADGTVVVADRENSRVQLFSRDGALKAVWTHFYRPSDIWIDGDDRIHVSDAIPTLTAMAADGSILGRCRPTLNGPHGLSGDAAGNLYLAENNPSRVTRLVPIG